MSSASQTATEVLDQLIGELGDQSGPIERVVAEWRGADAAAATISTEQGPVRETALKVIEELGDTWGPTGDPTWVDGLVPGRPDDYEKPEMDFMFALYRRPGIFSYVRLRGENNDKPGHMRLILGVIRMPADT